MQSCGKLWAATIGMIQMSPKARPGRRRLEWESTSVEQVGALLLFQAEQARVVGGNALS
jgi:hypothetical protein